MKLDSCRRIKARGDDPGRELAELSTKFRGQVEAIFSGLPKPKEPGPFSRDDLPLLFTTAEVQEFALKHRLNKSQTKAVNEMSKAGLSTTLTGARAQVAGEDAADEVGECEEDQGKGR